MKTYTIYHIPGVKIGCSSEPEKRVRDQGFTSYEVLEVHDDIFVASEREIELQKEYGYRVDRNPYWQSVENRLPSYDVCAQGGKTQGDINSRNGHMKRIQKENAHLGAAGTNSIKKICERCGYTSTPAGIYHHQKKCK